MWNDAFADYLRQFMVTPMGDVQIPVRIAVELARAARDFELLLGTAPQNDMERLAEALRYLEAVDRDKLDDDVADGLADAIGGIKKVLDDTVAPQQGPTAEEQEKISSIIRRATVPRDDLLKAERAAFDRVYGNDDGRTESDVPF